MLKFIYVFIYVLCATLNLSAQETPSNPNKPQRDSLAFQRRLPQSKFLFNRPEVMPIFPGCEKLDANRVAFCTEEKLRAFVAENILYPKKAKEDSIQGTVLINFVVNEDGTIGDYRLRKPISPDLNQEAMRIMDLLKNQPERWVPGKTGNNTVKTQMMLPVRFSLIKESPSQMKEDNAQEVEPTNTPKALPPLKKVDQD